LRKIEEIRKTAFNINLEETERFLNKFNSKTEFKIESQYPTINTIKCEIEKGDRCFNFTSGDILPKGPPVKYQDKAYGFQEPFLLTNNDQTLNVVNGVSSISINIGQGRTNGSIWELETENTNELKTCRAILPLLDFKKKPATILESSPFNTGSSLRVAGLVELNINNYRISLFDYKICDSESLVIDCYDDILIPDFEKIISSIIYCYGLLSGCLIRDEITILQFNSTDFKDVTNLYFRRIEESLNGIPSVDPRLFHQMDKDKRPTQYIPKVVFENLVTKSLLDPRLLRSIKLINESWQYPLVIRASTFSVALETLKNVIIEENQKTVNPFKSKITASSTIKKLKNIVNEKPDSDFNNKKSVLNKLEQLNQVGNRDSFLLSFKLLKIDLNEDDRRCINMRNEFLHGRIPFENENDKEDYQIQHIVYKLHLLTSSLIMKYCGYKGLMLNNIKLVDLIYFKKNIKEPLFRKI